VLDKTATIAENKNADLVLLDQNPLEKIGALRSVSSVIVRGRYLNRESLNRMLEGARNKKEQLDQLRK
jgi:imidazolonepropionase-like amidohydrolase